MTIEFNTRNWHVRVMLHQWLPTLSSRNASLNPCSLCIHSCLLVYRRSQQVLQVLILDLNGSLMLGLGNLGLFGLLICTLMLSVNLCAMATKARHPLEYSSCYTV